MSSEDLKQLILDKSKLVEAKDFYGLLEVSSDATRAQVQKAYFRLAKLMHPDRVAKHRIDGIEDDAVKVFKVLSDAYNTLIDDGKRRAYDNSRPKRSADGSKTTAELKEKVSDHSTQELLRERPSDLGITAIEAAKIFSHKGAMLMKKGAWAEAEQFFQRAVDADADSARYNLQLGWAIYQNGDREGDKRLDTARPYLEKAVKLDEKNAEAHYYVARLYKDLGEGYKCKKHLEAALASRPNYIEVKRELRLIEMRERRGDSPVAQKKGSKSGKGDDKSSTADAKGGRWPFGLDRLFKKK